MIQKLLCWLFSIVYKKWLWNERDGEYDEVKHVHSWRSARVKTTTKSVRWIQPCFWIFK